MATKPANSKSHGLSLNLGLNAVDPSAYAGWSGPLAACEFDANDMPPSPATRASSRTCC